VSGAGLEVALSGAGLDVAGLDVAGLEVAGLEVAGLEVAGLDVAGLDVAGLDVAGHHGPWCAVLWPRTMRQEAATACLTAITARPGDRTKKAPPEYLGGAIRKD
jgi:hypothetical protein